MPTLKGRIRKGSPFFFFNASTLTAMPTSHVSYYRSGEALRSRSVGGVMLSGHVEVPAPPARLVADWHRDITQQLDLEPGDVEVLPLARARTRWPDYAHCVNAMRDWMNTLGLHTAFAHGDIALMACRGARYHHDGAQYGGSAFCNLFLSEDRGLDLHFPFTNHRIPLTRGTAVVFDTGQPHGVIARNSPGFDAAHFPDGQDLNQVFLTWELPIEDAALAQALQVRFDTDPTRAALLDAEQVWVDGMAGSLCPQSGQWRPHGGG